MLTKEQIESFMENASLRRREPDRDAQIVEICRLALLGLDRDERAERIGRAVLLSFGYSPLVYRDYANNVEVDGVDSEPVARLLRAIADAMEAADG